jgi:RNA polymerase sigma-70 factor (ECF subfamily)
MRRQPGIEAPSEAVTKGAARPITPASVVTAAGAMTGRRQARQGEPVLERLARLDAAAWQDLFNEYFRKMYSFAYVRTGDIEAAEDIAAEVFAAAARRIGSYRDTGAPIGAWLYRIARNLTADYLERRRRRPQVSLEGIELESLNWAAGLEDKNDLAAAIAALTRDQQEVITLRFINDCSLEETARTLGKSTGAVKLLQHRAIASLRRHLGETRKGGRAS